MPRAPKHAILHQDKLIFPEKYLRFATPAEAAVYRAERLKCGTIVEIGCGIGGQTIAFAERCKKVIAIEIDKEQLEITKKNLQKLNITNVKLILGDALAGYVFNQVKAENPDIVFCDTSRPEFGKRSIDDLKPNVRKLIDMYSKITEKIAVEIPPFVKDLDSVEVKFEREFLSIDGELNRLTLYFNNLKKCDKSVVALPEGDRLESKKAKEVSFVNSASGFKYLYIIDPAVQLAGMVNEMAEGMDVNLINLNEKIYLLSKEKYESNFLREYEIKAVCANDFNTIIAELKRLRAGSVVLRYFIKPEDYWTERKRYESKLEGERKFHLFMGKNEAVICNFHYDEL